MNLFISSHLIWERELISAFGYHCVVGILWVSSFINWFYYRPPLSLFETLSKSLWDKSKKGIDFQLEFSVRLWLIWLIPEIIHSISSWRQNILYPSVITKEYQKRQLSDTHTYGDTYTHINIDNITGWTFKGILW